MFEKYRDVLNGNFKRRAKRNTAVGVTAGVVAGAVAGVLFAPKAGKELRKDIGDGVSQGADKLKAAAIDIKDATKEKMRDIKIGMRKDQETAEKVIDDLR